MNLRKTLYCLLVVLLSITLVSCYDMGNYENEKDYVDSFDVYITDGNTIDTYSMSDFFSEKSTDFILPDGFEAKEYKYLALKVNKDITVGEIAIFFSMANDESSRDTTTLKVNVSVSDHIPTHFVNLDDNYNVLKKYYEDKKKDIEDHPNVEEQQNWASIQPIFNVQDEPTSYLAQGLVKIKKNEYNHIFYEKYSSGNSFLVAKDNYILFEFTNNTETGVVFTNTTSLEEARIMIKNRRALRTKITFTNFLIEGR